MTGRVGKSVSFPISWFNEARAEFSGSRRGLQNFRFGNPSMGASAPFLTSSCLGGTVLSQGTFDRIAQVTELALQQMPTLEVIGRVTIIRGYAQLLALDASYKEYEQKLAKALLELSSIASRSNQSELSRNVQTVVAAIDADSVS